MSDLTYLEEDHEIIERPVKTREVFGCQMLPGQSNDGYGKKITTHKMVKFPSGKVSRIYATCFSNAASHWILQSGQKVFLRG